MPRTPRKATSRRRKTYRQLAGAKPAPTAEEAAEAYAYTKAAIDKYELTPTIVNPASNFVVVTYWWGRGNFNANMSRPCPDVIVEQIKDEIVEENEDEDPSWGAFTDDYVEMKDFVTSPGVVLTDEQKKKWIFMKAKYHVMRKLMIDAEKTLTAEQEAIVDKKDERRKSKFDKRVDARKAKAPYAGPNPLHAGTGGISRPAVTLNDMIERWKSSMAAAKCNYIAQEYPEFTVNWPRYYQSAINAKPLFIKKALESCGGRTVLYIDGDMIMHKYPKIFDMRGVDFMCQGWVADPRTNKKFAAEPCFDPYTLETSGGTMAYGKTETAMKLLDDWSTTAHKLENFGKAEDRVLSLIFTRKNMVLPVSVIQLPIEYLWLTDKYVNFNFNYPSDSGTKVAANIADAIIEHPECLTAEEAAKDQGAAEDRSPVGYNKEVTDRSDCKRWGGIFYEFVFFSHPDMVDSMGPYLDFMANAKSRTGSPMFNVIPWDKTYGEYEPIAAKNMVAAKALDKPLPADDFIVLPVTTPIAEIIFYLHNGRDVHIGNKVDGLGSEIQAAATNIGVRKPKRYLPEMKLDLTKPMFFSSKSRVVGCLIRMCESLSSLNEHLVFSYMFVSRIRWSLTQAGRNPVVMNEQGFIQLPEEPETSEEQEIRISKALQASYEKRIEELKKKKAPEPGVPPPPPPPPNPLVPLKVHQIWFGGEIPPWRQYLFDVNKAAAERNGFTYKLWQNADRTAEFFKSTFAYQNAAIEHGTETGQSRWAQVADLARMEIVYSEGGVYIDSLFETGDDFYKRVARLFYREKFVFIGCNEDPCKLECVGAPDTSGVPQKYLTNSFFAAVQHSPVLERLLADDELAKIDLTSEYINRTTGPYYLRKGIVDSEDEPIFLFETEEIFPFNVNASAYREVHPNICLSPAEIPDSLQAKDGVWLKKDCLGPLRAAPAPPGQKKPLAIYHSGLGGTWTF